MLMDIEHIGLALAVIGPPVAAALGAWRQGAPDAASRRAARVLALSTAAAAIPVAAALGGDPTQVSGLQVDAFTGLALLLVVGMGATVLAFASRSLRHEPYQRRFSVVGTLLVSASSLLVLATDLLVLTAAWLATSALAVALIRTGPALGRGARSLRARRAFVVGDVAAVAAAAVLAISAGTTELAQLGSAGGTAVALAGVLAVIAAATRAASLPFHRWLPDSLGAPTPSSALLHAGVVNGGAILLIKLGPVTTSRPAAVAALVIGGLTCIVAEAVMLTRPDVKGRLAWSTIAQMAFTLVLCGLGLPIAAALHLVAHGCYKGALFLGSGSAVRGIARRRSAPAAPRWSAGSHAVQKVASVGATGLAIAATVAITGVEATAELAIPLGLAWVAAWRGTEAAMRRVTTAGRRAQAALLGAAAVTAYATVTIALKGSLAPAIGGAAGSLSAAWILPVMAGLVTVAATHPIHQAGHRRLARAWRWAEQIGRPTASPRLQLPGPLAWVPEPAPTPAHQPALVHLAGAR